MVQLIFLAEGLTLSANRKRFHQNKVCKVSMKFWDYAQADKIFPRKITGGKATTKSLFWR